jgi:ParB/RepB/Spo0J family partition protein
VILRGGLQKKEADRLAEELKPATHLLIAGERRWKAAQAAGLKEIPVIVRELDDKAALEIQVIENLQREDLHPLEEAEGYRNLMEHHQYSAEGLAAKVGKSKAYIYARLKLTELGPEGRKALWDGKVSHSIGLLLARVHNLDLQKKALSEALGGKWGSPMSEKEVRRHLQENYMLRLADAPFDTRDTELVPAAGACATCPKRTGNQKELFADVQSGDVCTDPPCFAQKKEAAGARKLEAAMKAGQEVVATGSAFSKYGELSKEYVDLKDRCEDLGWNHDKTWRQTLGKHAPAPMVTLDREGQVHEILWAADAKAAFKASGHKPTSNGSSSRNTAYEKKKARMMKAAGLAAGEMLPRLLPPLLKGKDPRHKKLWAMLARAAYDCTDIEVHSFVANRRGLVKSQADARNALEKFLKLTTDVGALMEFSLELLLCARWHSWAYQSVAWSPSFKAVSHLAKVNLAKFEKQAGEKKGKPQRKATAKGKKK